MSPRVSEPLSLSGALTPSSLIPMTVITARNSNSSGGAAWKRVIATEDRAWKVSDSCLSAVLLICFGCHLFPCSSSSGLFWWVSRLFCDWGLRGRNRAWNPFEAWASFSVSPSAPGARVSESCVFTASQLLLLVHHRSCNRQRFVSGPAGPPRDLPCFQSSVIACEGVLFVCFTVRRLRSKIAECY